MSRFEITIILSLILAIVTVVFAYRKKGKKQDSLFGNCDSFVDKVAAVVFSVFYVLPSLGITFILLVWWKLDYLLIWVLMIVGWIIIPLALITIFTSRKLSCFRHFATLGITVFNIVFFLLFLTFEYPQRRCNPDIMQSYYESHKTELDSLCNYARSIVNDGYDYHVEFEDGVNIRSLQKEMGIDDKELKELKNRLDALGCFSVYVPSENNGPIEIGFRRVSMSAYYFVIFPDSIGEENYRNYMNDVGYIPYNHRVVFEYGSPAFGDTTFPGRDKYLKKLYNKDDEKD
jgi:hypothetical protein